MRAPGLALTAAEKLFKKEMLMEAELWGENQVSRLLLHPKAFALLCLICCFWLILTPVAEEVCDSWCGSYISRPTIIRQNISISKGTIRPSWRWRS